MAMTLRPEPEDEGGLLEPCPMDNPAFRTGRELALRCANDPPFGDDSGRSGPGFGGVALALGAAMVTFEAIRRKKRKKS